MIGLIGDPINGAYLEPIGENGKLIPFAAANKGKKRAGNDCLQFTIENGTVTDVAFRQYENYSENYHHYKKKGKEYEGKTFITLKKELTFVNCASEFWPDTNNINFESYSKFYKQWIPSFLHPIEPPYVWLNLKKDTQYPVEIFIYEESYNCKKRLKLITLDDDTDAVVKLKIPINQEILISVPPFIDQSVELELIKKYEYWGKMIVKSDHEYNLIFMSKSAHGRPLPPHIRIYQLNPATEEQVELDTQILNSEVGNICNESIAHTE